MPWQASTTLPLPLAVAATTDNIIAVDDSNDAARHHQQQVKYGYIYRTEATKGNNKAKSINIKLSLKKTNIVLFQLALSQHTFSNNR